eukprot:gene21239-22833_t
MRIGEKFLKLIEKAFDIIDVGKGCCVVVSLSSPSVAEKQATLERLRSGLDLPSFPPLGGVTKVDDCFGDAAGMYTCCPTGTTAAPVAAGACPDGWAWHGGACYHGVCDPHTYNEADEYCKRNGGRLTSALDSTENAHVRSLVKGSRTLWIGLSSEHLPESEWRWAWDGSSLTWSGWKTWDGWADDEPNNHDSDEDCAAMEKHTCAIRRDN